LSRVKTIDFVWEFPMKFHNAPLPQVGSGSYLAETPAARRRYHSFKHSWEAVSAEDQASWKQMECVSLLRLRPKKFFKVCI
jgi:hypothetical protein